MSGADKSQGGKYTGKGSGDFGLSGMSSASLKMKQSCFGASSFIHQPPALCLVAPPPPPPQLHPRPPSCAHARSRGWDPEQELESLSLKHPREEGAVIAPNFSTGEPRLLEGQGFRGGDMEGQRWSRESRARLFSWIGAPLRHVLPG